MSKSILRNSVMINFSCQKQIRLHVGIVLEREKLSYNSLNTVFLRLNTYRNYYSWAPGQVDWVFNLSSTRLWVWLTQVPHAWKNFFKPTNHEIHIQRAQSWKSSIRVVVVDYRITECQRRCLSYQTGKAVPVHAKHNTHWGNMPVTVLFQRAVA